MTKAISYVRFSTVAQGDKGRDSTTRQKRALEEALKKWNLDFDKEFIDAGKSGYKQRHIKKGGAMHELRKLAIEGKLAGKVLVIEDWDRAGRMEVTDAAPLLLDMVNNGVELVVGQNGGDYFSKEIINKNPYVFYGALESMKRGFEESKRKMEMARNKYQSRMEALANGQQVALNCYPFWIEMERDNLGKCTGKHHLKKDMVNLVKEIYALYLSGIGTQKIAAVLNKKNIPTPLFNNGSRADSKRGWYQGRVLRLIKDRSVLGFYQDKKNGKEYKAFDAIISETNFYTANNKRKERVCFAGRRTERVNPFAGLFKCANCGGAVSLHPTGQRGKVFNYLQCRYPHDKSCGKGGIRLEKFEESFWGFLIHIDDLKLGQNSQSDEPLKSLEIQGRIDALDNKIAKTKTMFDKALDGGNDATSLGNILTGYDKQKTALKRELEEETTKEKGRVKVDAHFLEYLHSLLVEGKLDEPATRLEMQEALRAVVDKICMDTVKKSYVVTFKNSPKVFTVQFTNLGKRGGIGGYTTTILCNEAITITKGGSNPPKMTPEARAAYMRSVTALSNEPSTFTKDMLNLPKMPPEAKATYMRAAFNSYLKRVNQLKG